jgi:Bacterial antitoxin of type II TA system, VapB
MQMTVTIDDELLKQASDLTGIKEPGPLLEEALKSLISSESARRLMLIGGTDPDLRAAPRRRDAHGLQ